MFNKSDRLLLAVFVISTILILAFRDFFEQHNFALPVLRAGNTFLYLITAISMRLLSKGLHADTTQVFIRNAYSGIMIKLFACGAAAFIYILVAGKSLNTPALFGCMGLYLVYTFAELTVILKQSNERKNVKKMSTRCRHLPLTCPRALFCRLQITW